MKKHSILFLLINLFYNLNSQNFFNCEVKFPKTTLQKQQFETASLQKRADWACEIKTIAVNFHFIQTNNGTKNFNSTSDGFGGPTSGYDYAHLTIEALNNNWLSQNEKMHLPPGNNTIQYDKKYNFIVHGVYFHKDDACNDISGPDPATLRPFSSSNPNWQFDIFVQTDNFTSNPTFTGYAISTLGTYYTTGGYYVPFTRVATSSISYEEKIKSSIWHVANTLDHEFGHLLSLDHTMVGCPTVKDNNVTAAVAMSCDDGFSQTPTAYYIRDVLNSPINPWDYTSAQYTQYKEWTTNNRMDYCCYTALVPQQINRIHSLLENSAFLRNYLICERVKFDVNLCSFDNDITAYYGKKVEINRTCSTTSQSIVDDRKYVKVFFNDNERTEVFNGFEVKDNGYFEILSTCVCY